MKVLGFILMVFLVGCAKDAPGDVMLSSDVLNIPGTHFSASNNTFEKTYTKFTDSLKQQDSLQIIAEVDHAANARAVGRVLNPNRVIFFSDASLAAEILQKNQLSALDLPVKVLFFQNPNGVTFALYNSVNYMDSRYGLEGIPALTSLDSEIQKLVKSATSAIIKQSVNNNAELEEGIITKESAKTFGETYTDLKNAISSYQDFDLIAEVNHTAKAAEQGLTLRPTITFIISNPTLGTALIQNSQTAGLDLPEKIVLWQDKDSIVKVSYNDPAYLKTRHSITNSSEEITQFSTLLDSITSKAISQ